MCNQQSLFLVLRFLRYCRWGKLWPQHAEGCKRSSRSMRIPVPSHYDTNRTLRVDYGDRTTWGSNRTADNDYPTNVTMTAEEGSTFSATFSDIETYAEETFAKFIIGEEPLDQIGTFQEKLRSMGIDTCLAIKQDAYDRYMQR